MKKLICILIFTLLVSCFIFSFDFTVTFGTGVKIGKTNAGFGGIQMSWGSMNGRGVIDCAFIGGYKNFIIGIGAFDYMDYTEEEEQNPAITFTLGWNFDTGTLVTPSVFLKLRSDGAVCVSVAAMFNVSFHKCDRNYETIDQKEATCTEDGYIKYKCKACGEISTHYIPASHNYITIESKKGSCNELGYNVVKCIECGYTTKEYSYGTHHFYWEPSSYWIDYYKERCSSCGKYSGRVKDHGKIYSF